MSTLPNVLSLFGSSSSTGTGGGSALADYSVYLKRGPQQFEDYKKQKLVQKAVDDFKAALADIKTPDDFLKNRKVFDFAMKAFGLGLAPEETGLTRRAITQDPTDTKALANRLTDSRYLAITKAFDFVKSGVTKLSDPSFVDDIVAKYLQNGFEAKIGEKNSAVRDAIVFRRNVGNITKTIDILGNGILRRVVTGALQLPDEMAIQSTQKQISEIDKRIDTTKFELNPTSSSGSTLPKLPPAQQLANANSALSIVDNTKSVVDNIAGQLLKLDTDYSQIDANFAANAADRPLQEANLPGAVTSRGAYTATIGALSAGDGSINAAVNAINTAIAAIDAGSGDPVSGAAASYANAVAKVTQARDQFAATDFGSYQGERLAVTGAAPGTFTNGTALVKTVSFTAALSVDVKSYDLQPTLDLANQAASSLGSYNPGSARDALIAARDNLQSAQTAAQQISASLGTDLDALNTGFNGITANAVPIATADVYRGQQAVSTANTALGNISATLTQLRVLALSGTDPNYAGDRVADQTQIETLSQTLAAQLDAAGYTDSVAGETRNLLTAPAGTSFTYNLFADGTASIHAESTGLGSQLSPFVSDITNGAVSVADRASSADTLARVSALELQVADAQASLDGQGRAFALASYDLDPRGKLDAQYRTIATFASSAISLSTFNQVNLLRPGATDVAINSTDLPGSTAIKALPNFSADVADKLSAGAAGLPADGPFDSTNASRVALGDALIAVQRAQYAIQQNRTEIANQRNLVQTQNPGAATATANDPFNVQSTAFTDQFIRRYLITMDSKNSSTGQASNGYSTALSLLQSSSNSLLSA